MKKILSFLLVTASLSCYADWDLFPINQMSFYQTSSITEVYTADLLIDEGNASYIYFNTKQLTSGCSDPLEVKKLFYPYRNLMLDLDYVIIKEGNTIIPCEQGDFIFKQHAKPGDTWQATSYGTLFMCDSVSARQVMSYNDSVKYFSIISPGYYGVRFILSKNQGLLELIPFKNFFLTSADHEKVVLSYYFYEETFSPHLSYYFHLSAGDVLFWKYEEKKPDRNNLSVVKENHYFKDSVTASSISTDMVKYLVSRYNAKHWVADTQYTYYKSVMDPFLSAGSHEFVASRLFEQFYPYEDQLVWNLRIIHENQVQSRTYNWTGYSLNSCQIGGITDIGFSFKLDSRVGISEYSMSSGWQFSDHYSVIGSIINGEKWGQTYIPITNIDKNIVSDNFEITPNPCSDRIFVKGSGSLNSYKLSNINGQVLREGFVENGVIEMNQLPQGIYNLFLSDGKSQTCRKIVKIVK